jgi:hypothetical protein
MSDLSSTEKLFVQLYLDGHIIARLAVDLRARGFDVLTTEEAQLKAASDQAQLEFAATEDRAILTFNIRDFAVLHQEMDRCGTNSLWDRRIATIGKPPIRTLAAHTKVARTFLRGRYARQLRAFRAIQVTVEICLGDYSSLRQRQ